MKIRSLLLAGLMSGLAVPGLAVPAFAAAVPIALVTRYRAYATQTVVDFNRETLTFVFDAGGHRVLHGLSAIAAIQFSPADSVRNVPATDSLDVFTLIDGTIARGIFRRMDLENVYALVVPGGEKQIPIGSIRQIEFSASVLDVDRREFGKDFDTFGDSVEVQLATLVAPQVEAEALLLHDAAVEDYGNALGRRLAASSKPPGLPYEFKVVNSGTVNAFTIGGGTLYVYRGMLEQMADESEMAGILAHEIGHNVCKHTARQIASKLLPQGIAAGTSGLTDALRQAVSDSLRKAGGAFGFFSTLAYPFGEERDADYLGVYDLVAIGLDPETMISARENLQQSEPKAPSKFDPYLWTHETSEGEIEHIDYAINTATKPPHVKPTTKDTPAFRGMLAHLRTLPAPIARQVLASDTLQIEASARRQRDWEIDTRTLQNCVLKGSFRAYGGEGNDVRILLLDSANFRNYWQNQRAVALYDSGVMTTGEFAVPIRKSGRYHIVVDNMFSRNSAKTVVLNLVVEHTE